jgi:hypothetical protein
LPRSSQTRHARQNLSRILAEKPSLFNRQSPNYFALFFARRHPHIPNKVVNIHVDKLLPNLLAIQKG